MTLKQTKSLKHLEPLSAAISRGEAVKRSVCSFCHLPSKRLQRVIYMTNIWQYLNNFRVQEQRVWVQSIQRYHRAHTHLHTHTRSIIIVIGFKQKHILAVYYYWQRVVGRSKRLLTSTSPVITVSNNNHIHFVSICILSICMRTQIFDASGLATLAWVQAGRDLKYRQWSLSTELTLALPLSRSLLLSLARVKKRWNTGQQHPSGVCWHRCTCTAEVYITQQHDRSQPGSAKLF